MSRTTAADLAVYAQLGQRIALHRKRQGLTQDDLGVALGVHGVVVSRWETATRRPSITDLLALSKALRVPLSVLLDAQEDTMTDNTREYILSGVQTILAALDMTALVKPNPSNP